MELSVFAIDGKQNGKVNLDEHFGSTALQKRTLQETVVLYMRNQRRGTSMTKTRGLVSGGGRKPWKQKGTGNARAGSIRSPLWRKGGIIFGPVPRSFYVEIPLEKKHSALRSAILAKAQDGGLRVLESIDASIAKTKQASAFIQKHGIQGKVLLILDQSTPALQRAFGNISEVVCLPASDVNAWQILKHKNVVLSSASLQSIAKRISGK